MSASYATLGLDDTFIQSPSSFQSGNRPTAAAARSSIDFADLQMPSAVIDKSASVSRPPSQWPGSGHPIPATATYPPPRHGTGRVDPTPISSRAMQDSDDKENVPPSQGPPKKGKSKWSTENVTRSFNTSVTSFAARCELRMDQTRNAAKRSAEMHNRKATEYAYRHQPLKEAKNTFLASAAAALVTVLDKTSGNKTNNVATGTHRRPGTGGVAPDADVVMRPNNNSRHNA